MAPELYEKYTKEHIDLYGPFKEYEVIETERHAYLTPFMYNNVEIGNYYAIGPEGSKGTEFKADDGFITIQEEKPIVAVTVVGSGCVPKGYNILEWEDDEEKEDILKAHFPKRQRIDNLNGIHAGWLQKVIIQTLRGDSEHRAFDPKAAMYYMQNLSKDYYKDCDMGIYENTAYFRVGPPYPNKVTVRSGCDDVEDRGSWGPDARYPGDYAIRVVETLVIK